MRPAKHSNNPTQSNPIHSSALHRLPTSSPHFFCPLVQLAARSAGSATHTQHGRLRSCLTPRFIGWRGWRAGSLADWERPSQWKAPPERVGLEGPMQRSGQIGEQSGRENGPGRPTSERGGHSAPVGLRLIGLCLRPFSRLGSSSARPFQAGAATSETRAELALGPSPRVSISRPTATCWRLLARPLLEFESSGNW